MVRALALSFLLLSQASQITQASCEGDACPEAKESSVLMQRRSRNKQLPMRQAAQAATEKSGPVDLFQATSALLRVGASPDVIQFTNDTLEALETDIIPNLMHGYEIDTNMLEDSFATIQDVLTRWEESKTTSLQSHREMEAEAIQAHRECRQREKLSCEGTHKCHESCFHINETYITTETEYVAVTEVIKHRWCEIYGNKSDPVWRTSMTEKFSRYLTLGEQRIVHKRELEACERECESKSWRSQVESDLLQVRGQKAHVAVDHEGEGRARVAEELSWNPCDEKQHIMEHNSCALEAHREHLNDELSSGWHLTTSAYADIVATVKAREELRHRDFKALEGIKCLLKHIVDRAGKPCDDEDEPGEAETIITECESYWQIDVHLLLRPWNITYPEVPEKPEPVPATPHPCTTEWATEQYGWLTGDCFAGMPACEPCPVLPDEDEHPVCCEALTVECLACAERVPVEKYCEDHPGTQGCIAEEDHEIAHR